MPTDSLSERLICNAGMSYNDSAVETALEKVRELLRSDGGDIFLAEDEATEDRVVAESANALKLQLVVENSDCPECILPVDMLEPIALDIMSADLPGLVSVSISDPRVADSHV